MENYSKRFDSTKVRYRWYWVPFVAKKITTKEYGGKEHIDCGSYCEEFKLCDFFVQASGDYTDYPICYLGSFQHLEKDGEKLVSGHPEGDIYLVYKKSKFKYF